MSSRPEHDAFAPLAGVLVFYQNKETRKLGTVYGSGQISFQVKSVSDPV